MDGRHNTGKHPIHQSVDVDGISVAHSGCIFRWRAEVKIPAATVLLAAVMLSAVSKADAVGISLNFNSIGTGNNTAVQSYLDAQAGAGNITVHGAVAGRTYNGDGFVFKDSYNIRETLGTSEFVNGVLVPNSTNSRNLVYDTFLYNVGGEGATNTPYGSYGDDKIVFDFRTAINGISFDWEIFPDASCQHPGEWNGCGSRLALTNLPDFELWAGTGSQRLYHYYTGDANNNFPIVTDNHNDYPQGIGHFSVTFATPVTHVEFVDWPARIGVDNIVTEVRLLPEPPMMALLGLQLLGFAWTRSRGKR
jgi:hypothetical protein